MDYSTFYVVNNLKNEIVAIYHTYDDLLAYARFENVYNNSGYSIYKKGFHDFSAVNENSFYDYILLGDF